MGAVLERIGGVDDGRLQRAVRETWVDFFFSSRRRHTRLQGDWSSDVCSSDLIVSLPAMGVLFAAIIFLGAATPRRVSEVLILYLWTTAARVVRSTVIAAREHEIGRASCRERV